MIFQEKTVFLLKALSKDGSFLVRKLQRLTKCGARLCAGREIAGPGAERIFVGKENLDHMRHASTMHWRMTHAMRGAGFRRLNSFIERQRKD
ncbi:MAG: hypothetical protein HY272_03445 [Gammaproteobacteria bacterium]|nr:hypothetical protein [Gammaproteobacteria bacterium]